MSFSNLTLHSDILKAVQEAGHITPTPIQVEAIPQILQGMDLRASAQTGTGKTAAFLLPAIQRLTLPSNVKLGAKAYGPRILILVPTRELAMQVAAQSIKYSKFIPRTKTVCIYGGVPYPVQNKDLSRPYEILVATPGRLIDHLERGRIDFSRLEMLILDEADRMLDMGFIEPVELIAEALPKERQTLLFSATLKGSVLNLSKRLLNNPVEVTIQPEQNQHKNIDQRIYFADNITHKYRLLDHFLADESIKQAIIFTSTKSHADELVDRLVENGLNAAALHGDMNQRQRTRTINQLRNQTIQFLVATDVAARGIDILTISHVINFDLPHSNEDYVHRIGRTGRAGGQGIAISFVSAKENMSVKKIESYTGQPITVHVVSGLEPKITPKPLSKSKPAPFANRERRSQGFRQDTFRPKPKKEFKPSKNFSSFDTEKRSEPRRNEALERKPFSRKETAPREPFGRKEFQRKEMGYPQPLKEFHSAASEKRVGIKKEFKETPKKSFAKPQPHLRINRSKRLIEK